MTMRRFAVALGAIALVAFTVRVVYVVLQTRLDLFVLSFEGGDAQFYLEIARNIAAGSGMSVSGRPTAFVGPGYPLFLAALLRIGADPLTVGVIQAGLGAATAVLAGLTSLELARAVDLEQRVQQRVALASAGLVALYPHLVFWTGYVLTETLFVFLVAAALYALVRARRTRAIRAALIAGLVAGLAAVTRAPFLVVGLALGGGWYLRDTGPRRGLLATAFLLALLLPVGAWTARNIAVMGAPVVTSTESGFVFYTGNSPGATGGSRGYVDEKDFRLPAGPPPPGGEVERDRFFLGHALAHVASDPLAVIGRWPAKVVNMWRPSYEGASARNEIVTLVTYVPVLLTGLAGATYLAFRGGLHSSAVTPALFLFIWAGIHIAVTGMIRFRLPAELVLMEAAPFAGLAALERIRRRR